jgi:hypothetical protein
MLNQGFFASELKDQLTCSQVFNNGAVSHGLYPAKTARFDDARTIQKPGLNASFRDICRYFQAENIVILLLN